MNDIVHTFTMADNYPVPQDPIVAKLRKARALFNDQLTRSAGKPVLSQRVALPALNADAPHTGTITRVAGDNFRVTWDSHGRKTGQPRQKSWYPVSMFSMFTVIEKG